MVVEKRNEVITVEREARTPKDAEGESGNAQVCIEQFLQLQHQR